jgi:hypothetical protein
LREDRGVRTVQDSIDDILAAPLPRTFTESSAMFLKFSSFPLPANDKNFSIRISKVDVNPLLTSIDGDEIILSVNNTVRSLRIFFSSWNKNPEYPGHSTAS